MFHLLIFSSNVVSYSGSSDLNLQIKVNDITQTNHVSMARADLRFLMYLNFL